MSSAVLSASVCKLLGGFLLFQQPANGVKVCSLLLVGVEELCANVV
jgi:hypothetical protein